MNSCSSTQQYIIKLTNTITSGSMHTSILYSRRKTTCARIQVFKKQQMKSIHTSDGHFTFPWGSEWMTVNECDVTNVAHLYFAIEADLFSALKNHSRRKAAPTQSVAHLCHLLFIHCTHEHNRHLSNYMKQLTVKVQWC